MLSLRHFAALVVSNMPDCALAANACAAACTLLVLGVALTCCVRWPFCYESVKFLLREGVYLVTGGRHFCRTNRFFYLP